MGIQITKKGENRVVRAFSHKLADIPNGMTIKQQGAPVAEGTVIGVDNNGLGQVIKTAKVLAYDGETKKIAVAKGSGFKAGDIVFSTVGGKAYAVSSVTENADDASKEDIVTATALGVSVGDVIALGKTAGASAGAFAYPLVGLTGEAIDDEQNGTVQVVTIGQVKEALIPAVSAAIKAALPTIKFI